MDVSLKYSLDGLTWREAILDNNLSKIFADFDVDVGDIVYKDKFMLPIFFEYGAFIACSDDGINWYVGGKVPGKPR